MVSDTKGEVMEHFNQLTPAQAERLAILAEECGEVVQVVGKILRHGYRSYHPVSGEQNPDILLKECADVRAAITMLCDAGDIDKIMLPSLIADKLERVKKYCHHQEPTNDK